MSNQPLTNGEVVSALAGNLLDDAAERMSKLVTRISDAPIETAYVCHCGESFTYMTLLELHRIEKHDDVDSIDQAVAFLGMTAAEQRGRADLRLIVDGLDREAFDAIDEPERPHGLGRTAKTVVLHRGVAIVYVLDEERDPIEAALKRSTAAVVGQSVRVEPSLTEALAIANQHDLQREMKW